MSKPAKVYSETITEVWLQVLGADGSWNDCGCFKSAEAADIEIGYLKAHNPRGEWRSTTRITTDQVNPKKEVKA